MNRRLVRPRGWAESVQGTRGLLVRGLNSQSVIEVRVITLMIAVVTSVPFNKALRPGTA